MEDIITEDMVELSEDSQSIITVIGVGGAGSNAVNYMWEMGIRNVRFMVCNTDQQSLDISPIQNRVMLGSNGLGAGNDPSVGAQAANDCIDEIKSRLEAMNTRMIFIAAGMGGGTGTGAAPVIAKLARSMGILTVAIVTSPLKVEGLLRYNQALAGIESMRECVDSILVINNENIKNIYLEDPSAREAFSKANEILGCAAKGIAEIITVKSSYVNVDFADVSRVIRDSGRAHMSVVRETGDNRALKVASDSLSSPLLDHKNIKGAQNILLSMAVSNLDDFKYSELRTILEHIQENAQVSSFEGVEQTANIIWGLSEKPELGDDLELVLVATGFKESDDTVAGAEEGSSPGDSVSGDGTIVLPYDPLSNRVKTDDAQKVVLSERTHRYPNINNLLRTPAYKTHRVKMIPDQPNNVQSQLSIGVVEVVDNSDKKVVDGEISFD